MKFNYQRKVQERDERNYEEYKNYHGKQTRGDFFFIEPNKHNLESKIKYLQQEITITKYPKRLKKFNKILSLYKLEHPELFI